MATYAINFLAYLLYGLRLPTDSEVLALVLASGQVSSTARPDSSKQSPWGESSMKDPHVDLEVQFSF